MYYSPLVARVYPEIKLELIEDNRLVNVIAYDKINDHSKYLEVSL